MARDFQIYAEPVDGKALSQFHDAMKQPFAVKGALMADAHAGYSLPIGGVIATRGVVVPAWVGYDIGCGMCAVPTTFGSEAVRAQAQKIFNGLYDAIPVGFKHNKELSQWDWQDKPMTAMLRRLFAKSGLLQLGSLGGGNHFIEIGEDNQDQIWIIIHSGSRGIGHDIAAHHMKLASNSTKAKEGHYGFDVASSAGAHYVNDLNFCQDFALANRQEMIKRVVTVLTGLVAGSADWSQLINRNHNHAEFRADLDDGLWIHRKGATQADAGMMGVIPGNMRDGSFIVRGKGNPQSLFSSSHGAGRVMGRREAKRNLNMPSFEKSMRGITARVERATLDESPRAYKDIFKVMELQKDLVEVVTHVKPIINVKG